MLPITVVGGYLGTGKTSLVNHLLRNADGLRLAVLVNEFGSLSIDEDLITAKTSNMISIAGGCVCCSYGNDLTLALMDMLELDPMPDHVLLEASGVAMPGAIAASVSLLGGYSMDGVVVLANAETVQEQAADTYIGDTITRQLEQADLVIINKSDLVDAQQLTETQRWLELAHAGVKVVPAEHGILPPEILLQSFIGHRNTDVAKVVPAHDTGLYATQTFKVDEPVDATMLASLLAKDSHRVLRAKGFVRTISDNQVNETSTLQVVGRRWSVAAAPDDVSLNLVVIGLAAEFNKQSIEALIAQSAVDPIAR